MTKVEERGEDGREDDEGIEGTGNLICVAGNNKRLPLELEGVRGGEVSLSLFSSTSLFGLFFF